MSQYDTTDADLAVIVTECLTEHLLLDAVVLSVYDGSVDIEVADDHVLKIVGYNPGDDVADLVRRLGTEFRSRGIRVLGAWADDDEPETLQYLVTWQHIVHAASYADALRQAVGTITDPGNTATFLKANRVPAPMDLDRPDIVGFAFSDPAAVFIDALLLTDHDWLRGEFDDWIERNPDADWPFSTLQPSTEELADFYLDAIHDPRGPVVVHPG